MRFGRLTVIAVLAVFAACGESRPRPAPVSASVIVPAPDALHVSVLAPVTIDFTGPLLPSSVTTASVTLLAPDATVPLPAEVTYDDGLHRVTLKPAVPLQYASRYRLQTTGILDVGGVAVKDVSLSFTTLFNALISMEPETVQVDELGRPYLRIGWFNGPDEVFGTADDIPESCHRLAYDERGVTTTTAYNPGTDGRCFTIDDVVGGYSVDDRSVSGRWRTWEVGDPGDDEMWSTGDDIPSVSEQVDLDARGWVWRTLRYWNVGPDKTAFSLDDALGSHEDVLWNGMVGRRMYYQGPGPDGTWLTDDDELLRASSEVRDASGRILSQTSFTGPGPDLQWRTEDDEIFQLQVWTYDERGLLAKIADHTAPGPDGKWGTEDDILNRECKLSYDANGARLTQRILLPGPDWVMFTDDDQRFEVKYEPSL